MKKQRNNFSKLEGGIRKKIGLMALILAITVIGITSQAFAENSSEKPANYVLLKAGMYSPSMSYDVNNFNGGSTTHFDSESGFAGEAAIGHYFLPIFAVELGAGYFESKGSPAAQPGDTKLRVIPMVATGKAFLPLGMFEPYGLVGIGIYFTDMNVSGNTGTYRGSTDITFGISGGAGFNINFHDHMFVGLEGKYLYAEPSFGGQHVRLDGFITTANLGFRF